MLQDKSIEEILSSIKKKDLSVKEVIEHYLTQIKKFNPIFPKPVHAFCIDLLIFLLVSCFKFSAFLTNLFSLKRKMSIYHMILKTIHLAEK